MHDTNFWVSGLAILFGLGMAWLVSRSISGQIGAILSVMDRLAANDLGVDVPMVERRDQIGAMARAVGICRQRDDAPTHHLAPHNKNGPQALGNDPISNTIGCFTRAVI